MKNVTLLAQVDMDKCVGCKTCAKVCPVLAIKIEDRKAIIDEDMCRGCSNCESRCPTHAVKMIRRDDPFVVGVDVSQFDREKVDALCRAAHLNPQQTICYCTAVRAEEVAAAILDGAKTPEELSLRTGVRTGCTIECIQPILRLLHAAGIEPQPVEGGWQWYGRTITAWELPQEIKDKYAKSGFYFDEDRALFDEVVSVEEGGK